MIKVLLLALISFPAIADNRYCWDTPIRKIDGSIYRNMSVIAEFKRIHPCPSTRSSVGPCQDWAIDHVIPLAVGGCDTIENLQWLPNSIKSCSKDDCKDRWERKIYKRDSFTLTLP